ncbi:hypothetical protein [Algoriphagus boritolerans]|uniref:hypothetical protein n=1 Tax=Algoriphagus boritolerans TaxID=308111 RepID=UPI000A82500C
MAEAKHLTYFHFQVSRFPIPTLGVIIAVLKSSFQLTRLIFYNKIDVLMPRSTMPALMLNRIYGWIKAHNLKVIFDADGFPIQERVDFAGLNTDSFQYRHLQKQEKLMLDHAHVIFTRSKQAIDKHLKTHPNLNPKKFFCVSNGRDECLFQINDQRRREKKSRTWIRCPRFCLGLHRIIR